MEINEILAHVDHTLLAQTATWDEIRQICDDGITYHTASVCIPPSYVKQASDYVNGKTAVCTVIGFPNGYMTTAAKEFETKDAITNGADEIDMVINIIRGNRDLAKGFSFIALDPISLQLRKSESASRRYPFLLKKCQP